MAVVSPQSSRATGAREGLFIVGADLLSRYTVEFDFADHVMRLMVPQGCKPEQLVLLVEDLLYGQIWISAVSMTRTSKPVSC